MQDAIPVTHTLTCMKEVDRISKEVLIKGIVLDYNPIKCFVKFSNIFFMCLLLSVQCVHLTKQEGGLLNSDFINGSSASRTTPLMIHQTWGGGGRVDSLYALSSTEN